MNIHIEEAEWDVNWVGNNRYIPRHNSATEQRRSGENKETEWNDLLRKRVNDFSMATMEARRIQNNSLKVMMKNNCQLTYLYSAKLLFTRSTFKRTRKL